MNPLLLTAARPPAMTDPNELTDPEARPCAPTPANAPLVGVVTMMALALPLVFALRADPQAATSPGARAGAAQPALIHWHLGFEAAQRLAAAANKPLMIAFYTEDCAACGQMERELFARAPIIAEAQHVVALKINAAQQPQLAARYAVETFPTILWTDAAGNEKHRSNGSLNPYELYQVMQRLH